MSFESSHQRGTWNSINQKLVTARHTKLGQPENLKPIKYSEKMQENNNHMHFITAIK